MKFGCLFAVLCLAVGAIAGKYSREMNDQKPSMDGKNTVEFRIAKLNQVWEKAIRVSQVMLSSLAYLNTEIVESELSSLPGRV